MNEALSMLSGQTNAGDLTPVRRSIERFASAAGRIDERGGDANREMDIDRRLNELFYGRVGYRAQPFPDLSAALASRNGAAISAAVGRTAHQLDEISSTLSATTRQ